MKTLLLISSLTASLTIYSASKIPSFEEHDELAKAFLRGDMAHIKAFLAKGYEINYVEPQTKETLLTAIAGPYFDTDLDDPKVKAAVDYWILQGAKVNFVAIKERGSSTGSPLSRAVDTCKIPFVKYLLEKGAWPELGQYLAHADEYIPAFEADDCPEGLAEILKYNPQIKKPDGCGTVRSSYHGRVNNTYEAALWELWKPYLRRKYSLNVDSEEAIEAFFHECRENFIWGRAERLKRPEYYNRTLP